MKKVFLFASAAIALLASCSSEDNLSTNQPSNGKEKIQFAAGDDQKAFVTRAGFTAETGTKIVAHFVSEPRTGASADSKKEYTKTYLTALKAEGEYSKVQYMSGYDRYWDDAHGRYSQLSVYAVTIPNRTTISNDILSGNAGATWEDATSVSNSLTWSVSATQTSATLENEDLAYSNNIRKDGSKGVYKWDFNQGKYNDASPSDATVNSYGTDPVVNDGRMFFTQADKSVNDDVTSAAGHFQKGHMEFHHALSRLQINLIKGAGYESPAPFAMAGSIQVNKMPYTGTFDIETATWSSTSPKDAILMAEWDTPATDKTATYEAQVVPGYEFTNSDAVNALEFTIDGSTYYITDKMLYTALGTYGKTMLQGNRYIFDITVAKSKIQNITATIVDWNEVTAQSMTVDNSHVTFSFYNNEIECDDVKLYKNTQSLGASVIATNGTYSATPVAGAAYTNVALVGTEAPYSTNEYYNDNNTAYHFRSLNAVSEGALNTGKTAFTMTSGDDDYHWGAPMLPTTLTAIPYNSETGYSATIAKGIVAADKNSNIVLTEIHMMSQLVIKLTTPEVGGVDLTNAEVYLTQYNANGTVDMSYGKITPSTMTAKSSKFTAAASPATNTYVFNVIPQDLIRNEGASDADYIGITIKTKDNNEYYIIKKLCEIKGTAGSEVTNLQPNNDYITTWYPGHKYTYTFNIKKKEIEVITATIVPWNPVNAGSTNLDLEK